MNAPYRNCAMCRAECKYEDIVGKSNVGNVLYQVFGWIFVVLGLVVYFCVTFKR